MTNEWLKIRDKINEAEQHIAQLKNLLDWKELLYSQCPNSDTLKKDIDALNFAIDFIKWGMK